MYGNVTPYIMFRRTQILLPPDLHRRASDIARERGSSLGEVVRESLAQYLTRQDRRDPRRDPVLDLLLRDPFDDPRPVRDLSLDVDYHLYGAPRRSRARRTR